MAIPKHEKSIHIIDDENELELNIDAFAGVI
jgi:hypothetical protein